MTHVDADHALAQTGAVSTKDPVPESEGDVPTFREQATGVNRREEVVNDAFGIDYFDRDAILAIEDEGTEANPIMVMSAAHERVVGISYEDDAVVRWFVLKEGEKAYDPESQNYFALKVVSNDNVDNLVDAAETIGYDAEAAAGTGVSR